jgi:hypothetical protein
MSPRMKKLVLMAVVIPLVISAASASTESDAQQLLITANHRASLFYEQSNPFQLDVDFAAQVNVPMQGHLTLKWEAPNRWRRTIAMGDFEQTEVRIADRLYTSRNVPFTPLRVSDLIHLLLFAENSEKLQVRKSKSHNDSGIELVCMEVRENSSGADAHKICVNSSTREILSDDWKESPDQQRKEDFSDYADFGGHTSRASLNC